MFHERGVRNETGTDIFRQTLQVRETKYVCKSYIMILTTLKILIPESVCYLSHIIILATISNL